jgi:hypothetical protein
MLCRILRIAESVRQSWNWFPPVPRNLILDGLLRAVHGGAKQVMSPASGGSPPAAP